MDTSQLRTICLVLVALVVGLYLYSDRQQAFYDQSAKPEIERILQSMHLWDKDSFPALLSDEARRTLTEDQSEQLLKHYRQFGELQSVDELHFSKLASTLSLFGSQRINYQGTATFSNGPASVTITLIPYGNGYRIYNFTLSKLGQ